MNATSCTCYKKNKGISGEERTDSCSGRFIVGMTAK